MDKISLCISSSERQAAKHLLLKMLAFMPLLCLVAGVNFRVDPIGIYKKAGNTYDSTEYRIAQELIAGKRVEIIQKIDDRRVHQFLIEGQSRIPDLIILGSSRAMDIGGGLTSKTRIMNHALMGAILMDYLGIVSRYEKKGQLPKSMVLLIDPVMFESFDGMEQNWDFKMDAQEQLARMGISIRGLPMGALSDRWLNIVSLSYFQKSIQTWHQLRGRDPYKVVEDYVAPDMLWPDGRRLIDMGGLVSSIKIRRAAFQHQYTSLMGRHYSVVREEQLKNVLEKFIEYLTARHVDITLCLLPFHPVEYMSFLEMRGKWVAFDILKLEDYCHGLARKFGLKIVGSYDPVVYGLENEDFKDGEHLRSAAVNKIISF